jgi:hypothetical protein
MTIEFNFTIEEFYDNQNLRHPSYAGGRTFFRFWNNNLSNLIISGGYGGLYFLFGPSNQNVAAYSQVFKCNGGVLLTLYTDTNKQIYSYINIIDSNASNAFICPHSGTPTHDFENLVVVNCNFQQNLFTSTPQKLINCYFTNAKPTLADQYNSGCVFEAKSPATNRIIHDNPTPCFQPHTAVFTLRTHFRNGFKPQLTLFQAIVFTRNSGTKFHQSKLQL